MAKALKSKKLLVWTKADVKRNVTVYLLNAFIIAGLFVLSIYTNSLSGGIGLIEYLKDYAKPVVFFVLSGLLVTVMALYFYNEERDFMKKASNSEMIFFIMELSLVVCYALGKYVNLYLRPLVLPALIVMFLGTRRSAVFVNIIFSLLMFLVDVFTGETFGLVEQFSALVIGITSGTVAIFAMSKIYSRFKLITFSLLISIPTVITLLMIRLLNGWDGILADLICSICMGPASVMLFLIFLPIMETIFKRISCFNLAELTDHKSKLIKRLVREAPGTFNHSIVVSNIAEACATAIGEDALLARTCAYYHDIGKLRRPEFFGENQTEGINPHDELTPELSTNIIKAHTQDGYNLVLKNRLPQEIADVCIQHHGTMPILYFYHKAKKFTDGEVDINQYCYTGPKPQTKIAAIIMIADGCEAAARTIKDRSREKVSEVVRKLVNERMELGQFDECEITIKELNIIIHTVTNNLTGIYHKRIKYPKVNLDGVLENREEI